MNKQDRDTLFSELIARHQNELYAYIFAIVRNWVDADDLFQSLCLVLWRKFELFRPDSSFFFWARQIAQFEVRKFLTRKRLSNYASDELLDEIAEAVTEVRDDKLAALEHCKEKLSSKGRELLELHYADDLGSRQIADQLQRSQASVCNSLNRIRQWLLECVQREVARQERPDQRYS
jgi:RNA polymerase sigma-70 factor, ECF subfamily